MTTVEYGHDGAGTYWTKFTTTTAGVTMESLSRKWHDESGPSWEYRRYATADSTPDTLVHGHGSLPVSDAHARLTLATWAAEAQDAGNPVEWELPEILRAEEQR